MTYEDSQEIRERMSFKSILSLADIISDDDVSAEFSNPIVEDLEHDGMSGTFTYHANSTYMFSISDGTTPDRLKVLTYREITGEEQKFEKFGLKLESSEGNTFQDEIKFSPPDYDDKIKVLYSKLEEKYGRLKKPGVGVSQTETSRDQDDEEKEELLSEVEKILGAQEVPKNEGSIDLKRRLSFDKLEGFVKGFPNGEIEGAGENREKTIVHEGVPGTLKYVHNPGYYINFNDGLLEIALSKETDGKGIRIEIDYKSGSCRFKEDDIEFSSDPKKELERLNDRLTNKYWNHILSSGKSEPIDLKLMENLRGTSADECDLQQRNAYVAEIEVLLDSEIEKRRGQDHD